MSKLPSFQFYPGDWLKDPALRLCSPQARALWIDMLCLMWETESRGILRTNGIIWTEKDVEKTTGIDRKFLRELVQKGVCAKAPRSGVFYSKRMVRDELKRSRLARNGQKGGKSGKQNPSKTQAKPEANPEQNPKQNGGSSSSSSFSSSPSVEKPKTEDFSLGGAVGIEADGGTPQDREGATPPPDGDFDRFWQAYPVKKDKGHARKAWQKIRPSPELTDRMLDAIAAQIIEHDTRQAVTGSAPYWKHPATWLNGECWNDETMTPDQIQSLTKRNARPNGFTDSNPEHTAALERAFG